MRKIKFYKLFVFLIIIFLSCTISRYDLGDNKEKNIVLDEESYKKAAEEFLNSIESCEENFVKNMSIYNYQLISDFNESIVDIPYDAAGIKEKILSLSYEASYTGDMTNFINYLKGQRIYEKYMNILQKYGIDVSQETLNNKVSVKSSSISYEILEYRKNLIEKTALTGDIVLCRTGDGNIIEGIISAFSYPWTHAGIVDKTNLWRDNSEYCILSSSDQTNESSSIWDINVGYEKIDLYINKSAMSLWRVKNRENMNDKAIAAVVYGHQFIGKDYNCNVSRWDNEQWYCSKIPFRCWYSQGIDLDTSSIETYNIDGKTYNIRDFWVSPTDIANDDDTYEVTEIISSLPPVAIAGPDQLNIIDNDFSGSESVFLSASDSYDPDGNIISWEWEVNDYIYKGENVNINLPVGKYSIYLTVTDENGLSDTDVVEIKVLEGTPKKPPISNAGSDKSNIYDVDNNNFELVNLSGALSYDPDGYIVNYKWNLNGIIYNGKDININIPVGTNIITLTVIDNDGLESSDSIVVKVERDELSNVPFNKFDYVGGTGGTYFEEKLEKKSSEKWRRLYCIRVQQGWYVDNLQFFWKNDKGQIFSSPKHGGDGGSINYIYFADDEYITKVITYSGGWVDKMVIYTNKKSVKIGGDPWLPTVTEFNFSSRGLECHGFYGRAGWYLDNIGFYAYSKDKVGR